MKIFLTRLILLLVFCSAANAQPLSAQLKVNGLTCSQCSFSVEHSIQKLDFVRTVQTDLNTNETLVIFDTTRNIDLNKLITSVYNSGFSVGMLKVALRSNANQSQLQLSNTLYIALTGTLKEGMKYYTLIDKKCSPRKQYQQWKQTIKSQRKDKPQYTLYFLIE